MESLGKNFSKFRSQKDKEAHDLDLACFGSAVSKVGKDGLLRHVKFKKVFKTRERKEWKDLAKYIIPRSARYV